MIAEEGYRAFVSRTPEGLTKRYAAAVGVREQRQNPHVSRWGSRGYSRETWVKGRVS